MFLLAARRQVGPRHGAWAMSRNCWLALLLVLLVAVCLRVGGLGARSLWLDEALSWRLLTFSPQEMAARTSEVYTVHPPLYFLLLGAWSQLFGDSEVGLRALAALCGVLTVAGTCWLTRELILLSGRRLVHDDRAAQDWAAVLAALFVAASPLHIYLSQQVRGYTFGMALFVFSSAALCRALSSPQRTWLWSLAYAAMALASCYTHYFAVVSVAAQLLFAAMTIAFLKRPRPAAPDASVNARPAVEVGTQTGGRFLSKLNSPWLWLLTATLIIVAGFGPWLPTLVSQSNAVRSSWSNPISVFNVIRELYATLISTPGVYAAPTVTGAWAASGILAALFAALLIFGRKDVLFLLLTGLFPVVFAVLFSLASNRSIFSSRYLCFGQVAWLIGFAVLVFRVPFRIERRAFALLLIVTSLYACYMNWSSIGPHANLGLRGAMAYVLANRSPHDAILVTNPTEYFGASYYCRNEMHPLLFVTTPGRHAQPGASHLRDEDLVLAEELLAANPPAIWVVSSTSFGNRKDVAIPLPDTWRLVDQQIFGRDHWLEQPLKVQRFERTVQEKVK